MASVKKSEITSRNLLLWLMFALLLRIFLMPISAHADLIAINVFPNLLWTKGILDIYSYIDLNVKLPGFQYYSPLTYFNFAFFQYLYHFISPTFSSWTANLLILMEKNTVSKDYEYFTMVANPHLLRDIFLAKTPYVLFDLASILVLFKFIKSKLLSKNAILLWVFNPILIYSTYIFGQYDIIPTFFVLLGFYLLRKNPEMGILSLGIGMAYKTYPIVYLIPVILIYAKNWRTATKLSALVIVPYLIFYLPIVFSSTNLDLFNLLPHVFFYYKKTLMGWALYSTFLKYLLLFASYSVVVFLAYKIKLKNKWEFSLALSLASILFILTLSPRTSFHYLMWASPILFLYFKRTKILFMVILIESLSFASYKVLGPSVQFDLFAPLNPTYFTALPTINSLINQIIPYKIISALGFFIFLFFNIYLISGILLKILFQEALISKNITDGK